MAYLDLLTRLRHTINGVFGWEESVEDQLPDVLNQGPVLITVLAQDGTILFVNRATSGELGKSVYKFLDPRYHDDLKATIERAVNTREAYTFLSSDFAPDGTERFYESTISPIMSGSLVTSVSVIGQDITLRHQQQREMNRRVMELQIVAEVTRRISAILDPDDLMTYVCDLVKARFALYHVHIYLMVPEENRLVLTSGAGQATEQMRAVRRSFRLTSDERGVVAQAARDRHGVISNNVEADPNFVFNPYLPDTRSEMALPMVIGDRLVGVLDVQDKTYQRFSDQDMQVMNILALQLAVAIQNAQLFEARRRQNEIANTLREVSFVLNSTLSLDDILDHLLIQVWWLVPYDAANFMFIKGDHAHIACHIGYNVPERGSPEDMDFFLPEHPNLAHVFEKREVYSISDTEHHPRWGNQPGAAWIKSWVGAPIIINDEVVGILSLDSAIPDHYNDDQHDVLITFASSAAVAIGNARLYEEVQREREVSETLRDIGQLLTSTLDQTDILQLILAQVERVLPHKAASIWLDRGQGIFKLVASVGYDQFNIPPEHFIDTFQAHTFMSTRRISEQREPVIIPDVTKEPDWGERNHYEWLNSFAGAPIIVGNQIIGQFHLNHTQPGFYDEHHKTILGTLTNQISMAIGNARLFDAERSRRQEIEAVQRSSTSLTSSLALESVLPAIVRATIELTSAQDVHVFLYRHQKLTFGAAWYAGESQAKPFAEPEAGGLTYHVIETGQTIQVSDVSQSPIYHNRPIRKLGAIIGIPLQVGQSVVGVMNIAYNQPRQFDEAETLALHLLAHQASIAIQNARLFEQAHKDQEIAEALRDIGLALTSTLDQKALLDRILEQAARVLPFDATSVWLDQGDGYFRLAAGKGYDQFGVAEILSKASFSVADNTLSQRLNKERQPIVVHDVKNESGWVGYKGDEWVGSWAAAPIIVRGELIGQFSIDHHQTHFYTDEHIAILSALSTQISIAVGNARLFTAERQHRMAIETVQRSSLSLTASLDLSEVLYSILNSIFELVPAKDSFIFLYENDQLHFGAGQDETGNRDIPFDEPRPHGVTYKVARSGEMVTVQDIRQDHIYDDVVDEWFPYMGALMSLPLKVRNRVVGVMNVGYRQPRNFGETEIHTLRLLASQASIAIENARLFQSERQHRMAIETVQRSSLSLTASLELPDVLSAMLDAAFELVPARNAFIYLYEMNTLIFGAARDDQGNRDISFGEPRESGITYAVARSGEMILEPDIRESDFYKDKLNQWGDNLGAIMGIPLKVRDRVVGVMNIAYPEPRHFDATEIHTLTLLTGQASVAIENARLFTALQDHRAVLEDEVIKRTAELEQERAQLKAILDAMGEGVIYDEKLEIKYINEALVKLTGFDQKEWTQYLSQLIHDRKPIEDETLKVWQKIYDAIGGIGHWQGEAQIPRKDGSTLEVGLISSRVANAENETVGAVTLIRDISQEKALKEQKDRFIANAAHELRTPLTNFKTRLYLLRQRPDKMNLHMQVMETVAEQMIKLVNELLDTTRFERGMIKLQRKPTDLKDLVEQVVFTQRPEADLKNITLTSDLPDDALIAHVDTMRIMQVVTNLVVNAISYTPPGGKVKATLSVDGSNCAFIIIEDTGMGIPAALQGEVYQPFFRAADGTTQGTGLGLAISKEIVDHHGGNISLQSEEGVGTTFTVCLPLSEV